MFTVEMIDMPYDISKIGSYDNPSVLIIRKQ